MRADYQKSRVRYRNGGIRGIARGIVIVIRVVQGPFESGTLKRCFYFPQAGLRGARMAYAPARGVVATNIGVIDTFRIGIEVVVVGISEANSSGVENDCELANVDGVCGSSRAAGVVKAEVFFRVSISTNPQRHCRKAEHE
jgi:hypothetical protein